jgi:hypothetical protein
MNSKAKQNLTIGVGFILITWTFMGLIALESQEAISQPTVEKPTLRNIQLTSVQVAGFASPSSLSHSSFNPSFNPLGSNDFSKMGLAGLAAFLDDASRRGAQFIDAEDDREIVLVEVSRSNEVANLLIPVFNWQFENTKNRRDIIVYIAPEHPSQIEDLRIAREVHRVLDKFQLQPGYKTPNRTVCLFHSQNPEQTFSLEGALAAAHEPGVTNYMGLQKIPLEGRVAHIAWIRTTLSRWNTITREGLYVKGQRIPPTRLSASLVDPTRKTITYIDLITHQLLLHADLESV